jgi:hypothetical protein
LGIWLSIKAFTGQHPELINLISHAIGFAGILFAYVFYKQTKAVKTLAFAPRTFRVISERHTSVAGLEVNFDGPKPAEATLGFSSTRKTIDSSPGLAI